MKPRRGEDPRATSRLRSVGRRESETRRTLAGSGMQQAHDTQREQAVEVVRNHEGGTRPGAWQCSAEGSLGSREWTTGVHVGGRAESGRSPREEGVSPARRESSEGEAKCRRPVKRSTERLGRAEQGQTPKADLVTGERSWGEGGRPTTPTCSAPGGRRSPDHRLQDLEAQPTPRE
jgi:hypothetical protein